MLNKISLFLAPQSKYPTKIQTFSEQSPNILKFFINCLINGEIRMFQRVCQRSTFRHRY